MNYGVAIPFSTEEPTSVEIQQNDSMEDYLFSSGAIYETPNGELMRVAVIEKLRRIVSDWSTTIGKEKSVHEDYIADGGGIQLRIFGSTRLGVHNADSDIDILCLAPSFISRNDFFTSFHDLITTRDDVESILSVPEAYTPVLKFTIDRQAVDMVFASLQLPMLSSTLDILDLRCLQGLDDASVRSINGARVAEWICRLVPDIETFCSTLRVIKYWARQRGLYSNMLGFLGGINFAILVAQICQLYIRACPFTLVQKFFEVFSMWQWPNPVMLRSFEDLQMQDTEGRPLPVWNSLTNFKDALHIMPIITPAYPAMNSAYNVSPPQFRAFQDEVLRAADLFRRFGQDKRFPWAELFKSSTVEYFQRHPRYVQVDICAKNTNDHRSWFGWVESRLRLLIISLEQPPVMYCHPIANCFHRCLEKPQPQSQRLAVLEGADRVPTAADATAPSSSVVATAARADSSSTSAPATEKANGKTASTHNTHSNINNNSSNNGTDESQSTSPPPSTTTQETTTSPAIAAANGTATTTTNMTTPPNSPLPAPPGITKETSHSTTTTTAPTAVVVNSKDCTYISSFMIGLSFQKGSKYADLQPAIREFDGKVKAWPGKKDTMDLKVSIFDSQHVPFFICQTRAEPSNVKSCTPQPQRVATVPAQDMTSVSARLFPNSAKKAPCSVRRDNSADSGLSLSLSAEFSNSSLSDRGGVTGGEGSSSYSPRSGGSMNGNTASLGGAGGYPSNGHGFVPQRSTSRDSHLSGGYHSPRSPRTVNSINNIHNGTAVASSPRSVPIPPMPSSSSGAYMNGFNARPIDPRDLHFQRSPPSSGSFTSNGRLNAAALNSAVNMSTSCPESGRFLESASPASAEYFSPLSHPGVTGPVAFEYPSHGPHALPFGPGPVDYPYDYGAPIPTNSSLLSSSLSTSPPMPFPIPPPHQHQQHARMGLPPPPLHHQNHHIVPHLQPHNPAGHRQLNQQGHHQPGNILYSPPKRNRKELPGSTGSNNSNSSGGESGAHKNPRNNNGQNKKKQGL